MTESIDLTGDGGVLKEILKVSDESLDFLIHSKLDVLRS